MIRDAILVPLWSGGDSPRMRVVFAAREQPVAALVVLRGGGYATSSGSGDGAAAWAAQQGMVGVEVAYRTGGAAFPRCYADAARAMRIVRARAAEWGVDPRRVGVLGFSAGGHLASLLSTQPTLATGIVDDLAPSLSARPDFVVLGYPLVSFVEGYRPGAFVGSVESFFGREADEAERRRASSELHVDGDHPPVFAWTTADDRLVPASHARAFAAACERARVPVELVVFPRGPHGMGLALDHPGDVGTWTAQLVAWLRARDILAAR